MLNPSFLLLACMLTMSALGQKYTISGYLTDAASGEKLIGATIYNKKTFEGAVTNTYGFYSLTMDSGRVSIVFDYVGFKSIVIDTVLNENMTLNISLNQGVQIDEVVIETQEPGVRIIDKTGPLNNPADRDHCIQYMVAVPMIFGRLTAADYEDEVAADARIDKLRSKMVVRENESFTKDYFDPDKRFIGNAIEVCF